MINLTILDALNPQFITKLRRIAAVELLLICIWSLLTHADPNDAITYFSAWDSLCQGIPDHLRTPVYPLVVGSLRAFLGKTGGLIAVYILQSALFLWSISWMAKLTDALVPNKRAQRWALGIYALYPGPLTLCGVILTEAFTLSATVGLLLLLLRAYQRNSWKYAIWAAPLMATMILLRPATLYIPGCILLFWIVTAALRKTSILTAFSGALSAIFAFGVLTLYSASMTATYGIHGPSSVSGTNNYFTARCAGVLSSGSFSRADLRAIADSLFILHGPEPVQDSIWEEVKVFTAHTDRAEMIDITSAALKSDPKATAQYLLRTRMCEVADANCIYGGSVCPPLRALTRFLSPNNGAAFLMLIILMCILWRRNRRAHSFSAFSWFLCGTFIVAYASILIGAQNEYPRLLIPNYPVLLLLGASLFPNKATH